MQSSPDFTVQSLKSPSLKDGTPFACVLLLRRVTKKTARNDNPFLVVEFGDRTGTFSATVFTDNPGYEGLAEAAEGTIFEVEGKVERYQDRFSPRLNRVQQINEEDLLTTRGLDHLVETPPESAGELWNELNEHIASIRHAALRATVEAVLAEAGDDFRNAPAAMTMHHAYRSGLLEHTVHMARVASKVLPLYPEVDPDLAMAGIIVHDVGKAQEYLPGLATKKSRKGILHGHVILGYQIVRKVGLTCKLDSERLERLEHIVLSHQGEMEWGAAALAATPEAVFVSMVDNLDAKMGMVQRALRQASESEFTDRLPGLNAQLLTTPPATDQV